MKNIFTLVLLTLSIAVATAQTKTITLSTSGRTIRGIDASSAFKVDVRQGSSSSAVVTVPQRIASNVILTIDSDGVVKVGLEGNNRLERGEELRLALVCPTLEEIDLSSAASVNVTSNFNQRKLSVEASSASRVGGTGIFTLSGETSVDCSSAAKVELNINSKSSIEAEASSASTISLNGSAEMLNADASSASTIRTSDLTVKKANAQASSSAKVYVKATETLYASTSAAGSVVYECPESGVTIKKGSGSSVKRK